MRDLKIGNVGYFKGFDNLPEEEKEVKLKALFDKTSTSSVDFDED